MKIEFTDLINIMEINKIIYYGRKTMNSNDIDLVVVSDDFESMYDYKRLNVVKKYIRSKKKLDLICLTIKEFNELIDIRSKYFSNVMERGEILYERRK
ncbi:MULTISPECIES: hypothetical protein [Clostridium]|uniref:hypothetical protein n=1 Tax=Clostridium TaxID=1485 RepID=UPI0008259F84|nr:MULTISPECIES: hypothetical protein [Clostridium]PJI09231.1 hypothetical protein CUB90_15705 [Clostridium sp. CT7]